MSPIVLGCGMCVDGDLLSLPLAYPLELAVALTVWWVGAAVIGAGQTPEDAPQPKRWLIGCPLAFVGLAMCTSGSVVLPVLLVSGVWALSLVGHLVRGWRRPTVGRVEQRLRRWHGVALALALVGAVSVVVRGSQPDHLVFVLSTYESGPDQERRLVSRIVEQGGEVTDLLLPVVEKARGGSEWDRQSKAWALWALAEVGGERALPTLEMEVAAQPAAITSAIDARDLPGDLDWWAAAHHGLAERLGGDEALHQRYPGLEHIERPERLRRWGGPGR